MSALSEKTKKVLKYSQESAMHFGHHYVGTEHVLLGLVLEIEGMAGRVLRSHGISEAEIIKGIEALCGRGEKTDIEPSQYTPRAKRGLELSFR
ncbi:MAG: hypothetical protein N2645_06245 [Clostridia bacterium]|nr:hypothetical protein [Clostridia bacterium]